MIWFWYFIVYSFAGFLLEVAFARVTGHPKRDRKCFLLLPLCPVYGLGALTVRWLTGFAETPPGLLAAAFLGATAAEGLMGLFCRWVLGVEFWSYRRQPMNLQGVVCLRFSLCWTVLALPAVFWLDPWLLPLLAALPHEAAIPAAVITAADGLVSAAALRREGSTEVLRWYRR